MLLGIGLHAALSFIAIPWVVQDRSTEPAFGLIISAIHGFRMPLFFLLSGFFTAMLWRRRGLAGLLKHRAKRIALPLALGCVTIVPVMWVIAIWAGLAATTYGATQSARDIWTAARRGDLDAVRRFVEQGASIESPDMMFGQTPLAWAVIGDQDGIVEYLLEAGAEPSTRFRDNNTPLHTAAFFGRFDAAKRLVEAGAEINARNVQDETPLDALRHDEVTTRYIASLVQAPIDFDEVESGRDRIRELLGSHGTVSGLASARGSAEAGGSGDALAFVWMIVRGLLIDFPFFHHLWFLWFLCWLVIGFALVILVLRMLPRIALPRVLVATPLCLLWLVPLTMLTQSFMHFGGTVPGFGPDTSAGLIPMPHVLAHYTIFFGFGALLYCCPGAADRLGRSWWVTLPLALLLTAPALALSLRLPWGLELVGDADARRTLSNLGQVLYTWLMIFGLMGLFERLLSRQRPWVRYLSDSSYWLYLVHLPLVIVGQAILRDADLPAIVKLLVLLVVCTAILLLGYRWLVRYNSLGTLLNGRRERPKAEGPGQESIQAS